MINKIKPYRSVLYMPGANVRALDKARTLPTDAIIFDLEDAVSVNEKITARNNVNKALLQGGYGKRVLIVRINGLDTEWFENDLKMTVQSNCDAVLLPKVNSKNDILSVEKFLDASKFPNKIQIWAMIETPDGVLNAS